jgi:hypothetical protein
MLVACAGRLITGVKHWCKMRSKAMAGSRGSVEDDLRRDLDETNGVINILERASRELTTIIGCDEAVRKNPLRHRQLSSIGIS